MTSKISFLLNAALLASLVFLLSNRNKSAATPAFSRSQPVARSTIVVPSEEAHAEPFRWSQLEPSKNYESYIANLRAIGCPEPTIGDIVRGDTERAFSWERNQLGLDGSGNGPWSRAQEAQLIGSLLGLESANGTVALKRNMNQAGVDGHSGIARAPVPATGARERSPSYPLFLQNPNWSALGFTPDQQASIAQVRQQFQGEIADLNEGAGANSDAASPNNAGPDSASGSVATTRWQKAVKTAESRLRDLLGAQGYSAYEQQQYYAWYQPQVIAAAASGNPLMINPDAFKLK